MLRYASTPATPPASSSAPAGGARSPQKHKKAKALGGGGAKETARGARAARLALKSKLPQDLALPTFQFASQNRQRPASDGKAIALCTAESYDFPELLKGLDALGLWEGAINLEGEAIYLPQWKPSEGPAGEVFIFESGAVISWGLDLPGTEEFVRTVIRGPGKASGGVQLGWVERGRYSEWESEALDYIVDPKTSVAQMAGDMIILPAAPSDQRTPTGSSPQPRPNLLSRLAFSAALARGTKLGVYEEQFEKFALGTAPIPSLLERGDVSPVSRTDIVKRFGTLHVFRQKLNLEDENLLDEPEFLWEDAGLHEQYESVCLALEFDSRLEVLNQRVDYAFSLQSTLMDLLNAKTSHVLEWIIIVLIAFEITITLYKEGRAYFRERKQAREGAVAQ